MQSALASWGHAPSDGTGGSCSSSLIIRSTSDSGVVLERLFAVIYCCTSMFRSSKSCISLLRGVDCATFGCAAFCCCCGVVGRGCACGCCGRFCAVWHGASYFVCPAAQYTSAPMPRALHDTLSASVRAIL